MGATRTTYTWDDENRQTAFGNNAYDPDGLWVISGANRQVWDNQNLLVDISGAIFTFEPLLYGNLISQRQGSTSYYHHFDGLGLTDTMTIANQSIVNTYKYRAFGETMVTGLGNNSLAFVGRLGYMGSSGLLTYYARARWYEPSTALWLSPDPIGFAGGDWNVYRYVRNNPVNWVDPNGLQTDTVTAYIKKCLELPTLDEKLKCLEAIWDTNNPLVKIAKCEAIHAAYDKTYCGTCRPCSNAAEVLVVMACLTGEMKLRRQYLRMKCDYILAISIRRGSEIAELGHQTQIAQRGAMLAVCAAKLRSFNKK